MNNDEIFWTALTQFNNEIPQQEEWFMETSDLQELCELYFTTRSVNASENTITEEKHSGIVTVVIIVTAIASIIATLVFFAFK